MATLPFSLIGGVWLLYGLDYNFSVAAAVGFIALAGVAAEFGVIMVLYLNQAVKKHLRPGIPMTANEMSAAIHEWCGIASATKSHDSCDHYGRLAAHYVGRWYRFGSYAAHRRPDDRWDGERAITFHAGYSGGVYVAT